MHVVEIEVHELTVPYRAWLAYPLAPYSGPTRRTVYVAHTDSGLSGLGEGGSAEPMEAEAPDSERPLP